MDASKNEFRVGAKTFFKHQKKDYCLGDDEEFHELGYYADVTSNPRLASILRDFKFDDNIYYDPDEGKPSELQIFVEVQRISDVDNLTSTFTAKVYVRLGWGISKELTRSILQTRATTVNAGLIMFRPWEDFTFFNGSDISVVQDWTNPTLMYWGYEEQGRPRFHLVTNAIYQVVFQEEFELENFPVDCQDLTMEMGLVENRYKTTTDDVLINAYYNRGNVCTVQRKGIQETDFAFRGAIMECLRTDPRLDPGGQQFNKVNLRIKIQRKWQNYFWRICLILSIVTLCGCAGFSMDLSDDFPDACAYMSTMLLTVVAFLFVVSSTLPAIPYLYSL